MFLIAIKNLVAHKFRSLALVLTVVLGVSFVVGTYVLTDTISGVFDDIFTDVYSGIDVNVRHSSALGLDAARPPIPQSLLSKVEKVQGVRTAEGSIFTVGVDIIDAKGDRVGNPLAPSFGTTWARDEALTPFTLRMGRKPSSKTEVAIDAQSFGDGHFALGDTIQLVTSAGPRHFTLVGVAGFGRASNLAGATISIFDLSSAQELLGRVGMFDSINVAAKTGVSAEVLQERVAAVLSPGFEAVTSSDLTDESAQSVATALAFFRTFMLVFAFVALFVGAFIIYNTYSIVVAERTRELALMRALGATGAGVLASILLEALVTGLLASGVAIGVGVLIAIGLKNLLGALGFTMPSGGLVLATRTTIVAMLGGTLVTMVASVVPAIRASHVSPLAAMRESVSGRSGGLLRYILGLVLAVGGIGSVVFGLDRGVLALVGAGAAALFIGCAMVAPLLSRPFVSVLGAPVERTRGVSGLLARQNARRNPRRTATTASALMVGTALMAASFILSRSITESVERAVTSSAVADLVVTGQSQLGFSPALATTVADRPSVNTVAQYRVARFKIGRASKQLVGLPGASIDPSSSELAVDIGINSGDITQLAGNGIAVQNDVASDHHWAVGDVIQVTLPTGDQVLRLVATYTKNTLVGDYVVDLTTFDRGYSGAGDFLLLIQLRDPGQLRSVQADIQQIVDRDYPGLKVQDRNEYVADAKARVAQFTSLITALLVLAIVIALLGVLITMLLTVSERTREIGLLRAVGTSRGQIRSMVRWEAAIVSLYGALLGLVLGTFFGLALVRALRRQGITVSVVPIPTLVALAMVIAVLGVAASLYPARRASRLNVIAAVSSV
ncbi:MAG: ABC transporter permease [Actinomycetes bacterium]